jgi:protein-arginine kinase activator protein McsA
MNRECPKCGRTSIIEPEFNIVFESCSHCYPYFVSKASKILKIVVDGTQKNIPDNNIEYEIVNQLVNLCAEVRD